MDTNENKFKYVVGQAKKDCPAVIRFFGPVDSFSVQAFIEEFLYLQAQKPSKIVVLINSEGGSVIQGMSVYSVIQSCPITTECVVEGIAASMGSVIWAAGDQRYMHDYSLLMIHNPFLSSKQECAETDVNTANMITAFKTQLATIYTRRFGFSKDKVKSIMDGAEGADGTWFDCKAAVESGLVSEANVIKTSKKKQEFINSVIDGLESIQEIKAALLEKNECNDEEVAELLKSVDNDTKAEVAERAIEQKTEETNNNNNNKELMENKKDVGFDVIVAQMGLEADASMSAVSSKLTKLIEAEAALADVQSKYDALKIQFAGKETEANNLQARLGEVENELEAFRAAEKAAKEAEIVAMVDLAIKDGKIAEDAKAAWVEMANANLELTKSTLASIPAREKITETIAKDEQNQKNATDAMTEAEARIEAEVKKVVGKEFELKKF